MREKGPLIEKNFLELLTEHRFREITIKMICDTSGINRSTFYDYFLDKYDLLDQMIDRHLNAVKDIIAAANIALADTTNKQQVVHEYFVKFFTYIYEEKQFFKALMTTHPAQNFTQKLMFILRDSYSIVIEHQPIEDKEYFINYTLGGQYGILFFWLRNDCKESPEFIADVVHRNVTKSNR